MSDDSNRPVIYWFRNDLRTSDLPGLRAACATGSAVICCYVLDDDSPGEWALGGASRWWLHHSLRSLAEQLEALGGHLLLLQGNSARQLTRLAEITDASQIFCSRAYEPWAAELEARLHRELEREGRTLKRYPGALLFEPEQIKNQSGLPFKVFTPFWRHCRSQQAPGAPLPPPEAVPSFSVGDLPGVALDALGLLPKKPDWASHWGQLWQPGSDGARQRLQQFLASAVENYSEGRDKPAVQATSRLSPHLHFGELSPRQVWGAAQQAISLQAAPASEVDKFLSELGWREFSYHLLHHFPHIPERAFKPVFQHFPWVGSASQVRAWQLGQTGYPIVDAGMRELWQTGYMHNRVRMIVASFLTKHLLVPWQTGEQWFWDTLLDADLASNACSWQWVAGSGADAAPYFRIFNPTLQGEKFDKQGQYVRQWVPEISALPDKYLHQPSAAPVEILEQAGIVLGEHYPEPIVDHRQAREAALSAYGAIKGQ